MSKIIALDAGHGMKTAGKRCMKKLDPNETREWWLNDRIIDKVEAALAEYDCKVIRCGDTTGAKDVSLSSRVKTANSANADIFISMHHNAGLKGRSGGGTVVFYHSGSAEQMRAAKLYNAITARTGLVGNRSSKIAGTDQKSLYVVRNAKMSAFLVENGFMDGPDDVPIILTEEHAEKTAQGVVDFLVKELSLAKRSQQATEQPQENNSLPYVTVAKGDTLSKIGAKLGVDWKEIAAVNGIASPYTIKVGQKLRIPSKTQEQYYPAYTGKKIALTAALTSLGINSTYAFRKQIAVANGISGYIGTASQNTAMYNLLVAGLLKKA